MGIIKGVDMKIKVGEYVRTIHGEIAIFKGWNNNPKSQWSCKLEFQKIKTWKYCCEEYIKSHSPDIIDLIEVGDIVNKQEVVNVEGFDKNGDDKEALGIIEIDGDDAYGVFLEDIPIKTIVTHEQMEEKEYKV